MQLDGATELERRTYDMCHRVETELPASSLATSIVMCLSDAGTELQRLRSRLAAYEELERAVESI